MLELLNPDPDEIRLAGRFPRVEEETVGDVDGPNLLDD
jgi:hypothetical protein